MLDGQNTRVRYYLDNQLIDSPANANEIAYHVTFDNDSPQPNITTSKIQFTQKKAIDIILNHLATSGYYQGLKYREEVYSNSITLGSYEGFLDFTDGYEDHLDDEDYVMVKLVKTNGLNLLTSRLKSISYGYLESINIFTQNDYLSINYNVEKKVNVIQELTTGITLYLMIKEAAQAIKDTANSVINVVGLLTGGGLGNGQIASVIMAVALAAAQIAYTVAIIIAITSLVKQLIDTFLPRVRQHKILQLRKAYEKVAAYLGYDFETNITELNDYYYLPSNPRLPAEKLSLWQSQNYGTPSGIPFTSDYGYNCNDMFSLGKSMFNAKLALINGTLHFRSKDDTFWLTTSNYKIPYVKNKIKHYNTSELKADNNWSFDYDLKDEFTIDNSIGISYEVITDLISVNDVNGNFVKGFEDRRFNVCLATRKDELNPLEEKVYDLAGFVDNTVNALGGSSNLQSTILNNKIGSIKQSDNWHSKPKILYIKNGKLPVNHRSKLSAKYLYEKYGSYDSFVANNNFGQKIEYKNETVPFTIVDYNEVISTGFAKDWNNRDAKITALDWERANDQATISYWIRQPYDTNLKETKIEA